MFEHSPTATSVNLMIADTIAPAFLQTRWGDFDLVIKKLPQPKLSDCSFHVSDLILPPLEADNILQVADNI